jgi:hypothetical protein
MSKRPQAGPDSIMNRAWLRDKGTNLVYHEGAMMLAVLVHASGERKSDQREVQRIMGDHNLDPGKKKKKQ